MLAWRGYNPRWTTAGDLRLPHNRDTHRDGRAAEVQSKPAYGGSAPPYPQQGVIAPTGPSGGCPACTHPAESVAAPTAPGGAQCRLKIFQLRRLCRQTGLTWTSLLQDYCRIWKDTDVLLGVARPGLTWPLGTGFPHERAQRLPSRAWPKALLPGALSHPLPSSRLERDIECPDTGVSSWTPRGQDGGHLAPWSAHLSIPASTEAALVAPPGSSPGKAGGQGQTGPLCRSPCLSQAPDQRRGLDQPSGAGRIPSSSLPGPRERPVRDPVCTRALKCPEG